MITRDIRAYMSRDWQAARDAKDAYWAARVARLGPIEAFRIADELRRQMILQQPAWPKADERQRDLGAHVRLAGLFHRAASTRRP